MNKQEIEKLEQMVLDGWEATKKLFVEKAWETFNLKDWDTYRNERLGGVIAVPKSEQMHAICALSDAGMNNCQIARTIGVVEGTVRNNLKAKSQNCDSAPKPPVTSGNTAPSAQPAQHSKRLEERLTKDQLRRLNAIKKLTEYEHESIKTKTLALEAVSAIKKEGTGKNIRSWYDKVKAVEKAEDAKSAPKPKPPNIFDEGSPLVEEVARREAIFNSFDLLKKLEAYVDSLADLPIPDYATDEINTVREVVNVLGRVYNSFSSFVTPVKQGLRAVK